MREDPLSVNERDFIIEALGEGCRIDGREKADMRSLRISSGPARGTVEVQLGDTRVLAVCSAEVVEPLPERPNEGFFMLNIEFSPMASPSFEQTPKGTADPSVEVTRIVERGIKQARALDVEGLCILVGKKVWSIRVDVRILDNCGNIADCASIATIASLLHFRRNDVTVTGDEHSLEERDPIPLVIHHVPVSVTFSFVNENLWVMDPLLKEELVSKAKLSITANKFGEVCGFHKAGGLPIEPQDILRCTDLALEKATQITQVILDATK